MNLRIKVGTSNGKTLFKKKNGLFWWQWSFLKWASLRIYVEFHILVKDYCHQKCHFFLNKLGTHLFSWIHILFENLTTVNFENFCFSCLTKVIFWKRKIILLDIKKIIIWKQKQKFVYFLFIIFLIWSDFIRRKF